MRSMNNKFSMDNLNLANKLSPNNKSFTKIKVSPKRKPSKKTDKSLRTLLK